MKKFETSCDMGSIKVFNDTMSCFFDNGIGDLPTAVYILDFEDPLKPPINPDRIELSPYAPLTGSELHSKGKAKFLGHFTVKTEAYLSEYDCSDEPIYTFSKGRWFVYRVEDAMLYIEKVDEDIHA